MNNRVPTYPGNIQPADETEPRRGGIFTNPATGVDPVQAHGSLYANVEAIELRATHEDVWWALVHLSKAAVHNERPPKWAADLAHALTKKLGA